MVLKQRPAQMPAVQPSTARSDLLGSLISYNIEKIVPIVGNAFRIDQIFCDEKELVEFFKEIPDFGDKPFSVEEQLTQEWSKEIGYPMPDNHNLARVSQYHQVRREDGDLSKKEYLLFLKNYLLDITSTDPALQKKVGNMKSEVMNLSFSDIVRDLKYPRFAADQEDPLNLLAKMPFPIYITTSHYDFLERALIKEADKKPRSEVIRWWEQKQQKKEEVERKEDREKEAAPDDEPTVTAPVVYHLFGMESDPASLVLSEDDYLKFLVSVVSDTNNLKPVVPLRLQNAMAQSHLLLLGYRLQDWDFRVLYRMVLTLRTSKSARKGIFIQLKPKQGDPELLEYLKQYFNVERFDIEWKSSELFIQDMWRAWRGK